MALVGGAKLDASGATGGGNILVGGDYRGGNADIQNANAIYLGAGTEVRADAIDSGTGGRIIAWSNASTKAHGLISAGGGAASGDGGFVETSSAGALSVTRAPWLQAPNGKGGTWLIDPFKLEIIANPADAPADETALPALVPGLEFASDGSVNGLFTAYCDCAPRAIRRTSAREKSTRGLILRCITTLPRQRVRR